MSHFISQIKYLKSRKKSFPDPLSNWTQISINQPNQKVKILFRQKTSSYWKYCIAPIFLNSILYTFLKIHRITPNSSNQLHEFHFEVQICLDTLMQTEKNLIQNLAGKELNKVIQSLSTISLNTFSCEIKSSQLKQKRLAFKFKTKKQCKEICQKIIKTSFFAFFIIIDHLKSYHKAKTQKITQWNTDLYELRYSVSSFRKYSKKNTRMIPVQSFGQFKHQQNQITEHSSLITLSGKSLFDKKPKFLFSFAQNLEKRDRLQKIYQQSEEKRKKTIKKEKIYSNIEIEKEENLKGFCIQTKFSIITQCNLVFKIIQTHMNRRYDFQKSTQNIEYFNYLVNITKTQSRQCIRKKPFHISSIQKNGQNNQKQGKTTEIQLKEKSKNILKTEKNCLDIMKESLATNICPYYVHYKEDDALYSKLYKMSLEEWKESNLSLKDDTILDIFLQILNGLYEMSQHKIIHRDLKPDNILIDDSEPLRPVVKLIDFGSTIFIHSDSERYQQDVIENFDPKLRTTKPYNMDFNEFRKLCCAYSPHNLYKYTESSYNRHANFDIYSVGKIMEDFIPNFKHQEVLNNLKFLIKICTCPYPEFRLNLEQTALFITAIKNFYFST